MSAVLTSSIIHNRPRLLMCPLTYSRPHLCTRARVQNSRMLRFASPSKLPSLVVFSLLTHPMASFSSSSQAPTILRDGGTITITPAQPHSALVVVTHGLGDSAEGFADVAEMWARQLPYVKVRGEACDM